MSVPESLLSGLTPEQRAAVLHKEGPLLILAGAGSGKTRVVTRRIAALVAQGVAPEAILAITFTNKAAGEMRERVGALLPRAEKGEGVTVSTFHAFAVRLLRRYGEARGISRGFSILDGDDRLALVREAAVVARVDPDAHRPWVLAEAIGRHKEKLDDEAALREAKDDLRRDAARVLPHYRALQRQRQALDFEDLVVESVRLLEEHPQVHSALLQRIQYVLVDEYQDTNHAQYRLARLLAGQRRNLAVCGDPDQSIYGWRGADMGNILRFEEDYPGCKVVLLERNYRSTASILRAANALIVHNSERKEKQLLPSADEGCPLEVKRCLDAQLEAEWVARRVEQALKDGVAPGEVAVVYRVAVHAEAYEEALLRRNVPCTTVGSQSFFERREVKDALAFVRLAVNGKDDLAALRALRVFGKGVGKRTLEKLAEAQKQRGASLLEVCADAGALPGLTPANRNALGAFAGLVRGVTGDAQGSVERLVTGVLGRTGIEERLRKEEGGEARVQSLQLLAQVAREADRRAARKGGGGGPGGGGGGGTSGAARDFLDRLALMSQTDKSEEDKHKVVLTTVHAAKGLEFDLVIVAGLEQGMFPHWRALEEGVLEEERRLAYVALTRARQRLILTYAANRPARLRSDERRRPSQFLYELPPELLWDPDRGAQVELPPLDGEEPTPASTPTSGAAATTEDDEPKDALARARARLRALDRGETVDVPPAPPPPPRVPREERPAAAAPRRLVGTASRSAPKPGAGAPLWARGLVKKSGG